MSELLCLNRGRHGVKDGVPRDKNTFTYYNIRGHSTSHYIQPRAPLRLSSPFALI
jgi:hypothetical protein